MAYQGKMAYQQGEMAYQGEISSWQQKQLEDFEVKFTEVDKNRTGSLKYTEIRDIIKDRGYTGTDNEFKTVFKFSETSKDAKISRNDFLTVMKKAPKLILKEMTLRRAFKRCDERVERSGYLSKEEIITSSKEVDLEIDSTKVSEIFTTLTTRSDKKVKYEDFHYRYMHKETATMLHEVFSRTDSSGSGLLTKAVMENVIRTDTELSIKGDYLSKLLTTFCSKQQSVNINYKEFVLEVSKQYRK